MDPEDIYVGQRLESPLGVGRVLDISEDGHGVLLLYLSGMSHWQDPELLSVADPDRPSREGLTFYAYDPQLPARGNDKWEARRRELFHSPALEDVLFSSFGTLQSAHSKQCHICLDTSKSGLVKAADIIIDRYRELYPGSIHELVIDSEGNEATLARAANEIISEFVICGYVDRVRREYLLLQITQSNGFRVQLCDVSTSERRLDLVQLLIEHLYEAHLLAEAQLQDQDIDEL